MKTGDWSLVEKLIKNLDKNLMIATQNVLKSIADAAQTKLLNHIDKQDLSWKPLSETYKKQKARKGLSEKTLIASGEMRASISKKILQNKAFVGIEKGKKNKEGRSLETIAATQEYGSLTQNIPARKLWQPTAQEVMQWVRQNRIIEKEVRKVFKEFNNVFST
ncbi:MAG: phage virion morphogenesis protein [Raineya sp.]